MQAIHDTFAIHEIAAAARVPVERVRQAIRAAGVSVRGTRVVGSDAVELVRRLRRGTPDRHRALPLSVIPEPRARRAGPLAISAGIHALVVALFITATALGLLKSKDTEVGTPVKSAVHLVHMMELGPGGGGGGGGLTMPEPAPQAERKAPAKPKVSSPVPPVKKRAAPPPRVPPSPRPAPPPAPRPLPAVITPPAPPVPAPVLPMPAPAPPAPAPAVPTPPAPAPQAIVAPVVASPGDANDRVGIMAESPGHSSSAGPGSGGGAGSGSGVGLGAGQGGGIGSGSGGGTGGGPFHPGAGIAPPQLLREVRAGYTDDARRQAIAGDVVLEIVVKRDGSVGQVRVLQSLGGGLEQKAIDAVKQWKFSPATRAGTPVDVVVEVSVGFKLR